MDPAAAIFSVMSAPPARTSSGAGRLPIGGRFGHKAHRPVSLDEGAVSTIVAP
jgi:hypothetical protein